MNTIDPPENKRNTPDYTSQMAQYARDLKIQCEHYPGWAAKRIAELQCDGEPPEPDPLVEKLRDRLDSLADRVDANANSLNLTYTQCIEHLANAIRALEG